ncbi:hypothetical protein PFISCL1PPCAC_18974, partial [Pristionchus fissidentatus]
MVSDLSYMTVLLGLTTKSSKKGMFTLPSMLNFSIFSRFVKNFYGNNDEIVSLALQDAKEFARSPVVSMVDFSFFSRLI